MPNACNLQLKGERELNAKLYRSVVGLNAKVRCFDMVGEPECDEIGLAALDGSGSCEFGDVKGELIVVDGRRNLAGLD
jgi:hypothetical protein